MRRFHGNIVSIIIDTQSSENKWKSNFTRGGKGVRRNTLFWNRNLLKKIYKVSLLYSIPSNVVVQIHKESDSRNLVPSCSRAGTLDLKAKISPTSQIFPPTSKFSPNFPTSKLKFFKQSVVKDFFLYGRSKMCPLSCEANSEFCTPHQPTNFCASSVAVRSHSGWPVGFGRLKTTSFFHHIIDFLILYRLISSTCLFSGYFALI